ncbi:RTA1 like protein-domain-containing protein [Lipomyces doorenjongii]|uniref:RTA1 like protein-domain-containing protein n=1 Tax=Lipomyces doorenjongii TaxID=383834 RepID=UPI0034CDFDEA
MDSNYTIPDEECTLQTCTLRQAHFTYVPSLGGNAFFVGWFSLLILLQIMLALKYRIWGYFVAMQGGIVLEILGYIGRIQMHFNPFIISPYLLYMICLTTGPAFLSAAVYLCLSRIVVVYGENLSRFKPRTYTFAFIACDFISLGLQGAGGGIAASANTQSSVDLGKNIMLAGLAFQVVATLLFMMACSDFRVRQSPIEARESSHAVLRNNWKFRAFLWGLAVSIICIFARSVYRVAELSQGFHGPQANQQVTFMVHEGVMIFIAAGLQTFLHPGFCFQESWETLTLVSRGEVVGSRGEVDKEGMPV